MSYMEYTKKCSLIYSDRYNAAYGELTNNGYKPINSYGTFYMLFDVNNKFGNGEKACDYFEQQGILFTAGINYGKSFSNTVRICLTKDSKVLSEIIKAL